MLGYKKVWFVLLFCGVYMYVYGLYVFSNSNGNYFNEFGGDDNDNDSGELVDNYMMNIFKVFILRFIKSLFIFVIFEKDFLEFFKYVYLKSLNVVLNFGDLFVFFFGWWYVMSGVGKGFVWSVLMWY